MMRLLLAVLGILVLSSCVERQPAQSKGQVRSEKAAGPTSQSDKLPRVVLLRTDLGIADGQWVRAADAVLGSLAEQNLLEYQSLGELPGVMAEEAGGRDVGLPEPRGSKPGDMTLAEAEALLSQLPECELLVISSGYLLSRLARQEGLLAAAKAVCLLDSQGYRGELHTPVVQLRCDIRDAAFAVGVAAGTSSSLSHFGVLYAADDPDAQALVKAVTAGITYSSNGAWVEAAAVEVGPDGFATPAQFDSAFAALGKQAGSNWKPNHFVVAVGRSTPSVMNALSKKPYNCYLLGGYGDLRMVRPARVVACVQKHPEVLLERLLRKLDWALLTTDPTRALKDASDGSGVLRGGLADRASAVTSFDLYSRYNLDGPDIQQEVNGILKTILAGELGVDY